MNWYILRSLNQLYQKRQIPLKQRFVTDPEVRNMRLSFGAIRELSTTVKTTDRFDELYEECYLNHYLHYKEFLDSHNLDTPQARFELNDIAILEDIDSKMRSGDLESLRSQIVEYNTSLRDVSDMFFKNDKYLDEKDSLINALKKILQVDSFSNERDQQYIYKLECHNPRAIVLCENINFLTKPERSRKHQIELWYVGGRNVAKLEFAKSQDLPIYYSGDWDYHGLEIFLLVKRYLPSIILLTPNGAPKGISNTEHKSLWYDGEKPTALSGLPNGYFSTSQVSLIESLIEKNQWISEESNDLIEMTANFIPKKPMNED